MLDLVYITLAVMLLALNAWSLYNIPVFIVGVREFLKSRREKRVGESNFNSQLPFMSIVVPVKNEEKVVGRLLRALLRLNYPKARMEIVVVNEHQATRHYRFVRILHGSTRFQKLTCFHWFRR